MGIKFGAVETRQEARRCADLFKHHREAIDGIVVTLPNFGDERAIADTLRMAGLAVPVLVQAHPRHAEPHVPSAIAATSFAARCRPATIFRNTASPIRLTDAPTELPAIAGVPPRCGMVSSACAAS